MNEKLIISKYLKHFSKGISPAIKKYARDDVFLKSRYIFTYSIGSTQLGYCTHCKKDFPTSIVKEADKDTLTVNHKLKHNGRAVCPRCGSMCIVKASGVGRKYLSDDAYFVFYEKSKIDPQAIVARGFYAIRNYSGDYRKVKTKFIEEAKYIFMNGNSTMLKGYWSYSPKTDKYAYKYRVCKSPYSVMDKYLRNMIYAVSEDSIKEAVKGTQFQYSTWESYFGQYNDMVKFFDNYSKYPCIEYLTKLGFKSYVNDKIYGNNTYGAINWKGKSLYNVFRLSKNDFSLFKSINDNHKTTLLTLRLFQLSKKEGINLSWDELSKMERVFDNYKDTLTILKYTNMRKAYSYAELQQKVGQKNRNYYGLSIIITDWKDYIKECIFLQMDLKDSRVLFPKDLFKAHAITSKRIKSEENKHFDMLIANRQVHLNKYIYEYGNYIIRPAYSSGELIAEGKALNICVGSYQNGYIQRYANGKTNIFLIRHKNKPDIPYFTVEINNNSVIQANGLNHSTPSGDLKVFLDNYRHVILEKLKGKTQYKKSA